MKKTVFIAILLISSLAHSKMNKLNFHRYAQPQLKNLVTEFFLVLKKLNPNQVYYTDIQRSLTTHIMKLQGCKSLKYCTAIDRLSRDLNLYEKKLWQLQLDLLKNEKDSLELDYDEIMRSATHAQKIQLKIYQIKNDIDLFIALNKNIDLNKTKYELLRELKQTLIWTQDGSTSLISKKYRKDFDYLNENFIRVIQHNVLLRGDMNFLKSRLNELDNSWNRFNLKVEREVQGFPKKSLHLIRIMHNRWNTILKLILR